jgi:hypothetical protein
MTKPEHFTSPYIATRSMFAGEPCALCESLIDEGDSILLDVRSVFVEAAHASCVTDRARAARRLLRGYDR